MRFSVRHFARDFSLPEISWPRNKIPLECSSGHRKIQKKDAVTSNARPVFPKLERDHLRLARVEFNVKTKFKLIKIYAFIFSEKIGFECSVKSE